MEDNKASGFVDRQIEFNKDILAAIASVDKAIRIQSKLNLGLTQQLEDQSNTIRTHRQLIIGITFGLVCTSLALIVTLLT
jgi:hypothetical protein